MCIQMIPRNYFPHGRVNTNREYKCAPDESPDSGEENEYIGAVQPSERFTCIQQIGADDATLAMKLSNSIVNTCILWNPARHSNIS